MVLPAVDRDLPNDMAGGGVQRHHGCVELAHEHLPISYRYAAIVLPATDRQLAQRRDIRIVSPFQRATGGVQCEDVPVRRSYVQHAIDDDRLAFE
jgi:hypothetical protein